MGREAHNSVTRVYIEEIYIFMTASFRFLGDGCRRWREVNVWLETYPFCVFCSKDFAEKGWSVRIGLSRWMRGSGPTMYTAYSTGTWQVTVYRSCDFRCRDLRFKKYENIFESTNRKCQSLNLAQTRITGTHVRLEQNCLPFWTYSSFTCYLHLLFLPPLLVLDLTATCQNVLQL